MINHDGNLKIIIIKTYRSLIKDTPLCDAYHVNNFGYRDMEIMERIFIRMYFFRYVWYVENGA